MPARSVGKRLGPDSAADSEHVIGAAGGFTGLWALTWLGSSALGATAAVQGGFAVGGVMAASGLTVLWWKNRALRSRVLDPETGELEESELEPSTLESA